MQIDSSVQEIERLRKVVKAQHDYILELRKVLRMARADLDRDQHAATNLAIRKALSVKAIEKE